MLLIDDTKKQVRFELIKRFVLENNRVPNSGELNDLTTDYYHTNTPAKEGISFYKKRIGINEESKTSDYNLFINDVGGNINYIHDYLIKFNNRLDGRIYASQLNLDSLEKKYSSLNSKLSQILLSTGIETNLISVIYEDFSDLQFLYENGNVTIQPNIIYSDYSVIKELPIDYRISYYASSSSYTYLKEYDSLDNIKTVDGKYWSIDLFSDMNKETSLLFKIELEAETEISGLKIVLDSGSSMVATIMSSLDDINYETVQMLSLNTPILNVHLNRKSKYIVISLSKLKADRFDGKNYIFNYKLDYVGFVDVVLDNTSTCIFGPYTFKDIFDEPLDFSYIQFSSCITKMDNSDIKFSISPDLATWIPVGDSSTSIHLNSLTINDEMVIVNSGYLISSIDGANIDLVDASGSEVVLNKKIPISYLDKLNPNNIVIKRNIPTSLEVFDNVSGWFFDPEKQTYKTTIFNNSSGGFLIDLGFTTAIIDNVSSSGIIYLSSGYHIFETSQSNWTSFSSGLLTESSMKAQDPLYPYNHRYLVEGYLYPTTWSGEKLYNSVSEHFGYKLKYVSYSEFELSEALDIYTFATKGDYIYILINTNKQYSDFSNEGFALEIYISDNTVNAFYVKAEFISDNQIETSYLHNFTIKAI